MAQYNFEGDINGISDSQLQFINNVIQEHGFENSKVTFEPVGVAGDNYAACVKRIIIEGENEKLTMIAKIAPSNEVIRKLMTSFVLFRNEHFMYLEVLPKLVQLQKDAGIPESEQLKFAKCYGSYGEEPNEVILLEDLKPLNYTMMDRFKPLSDDCVKSILNNFAKLHSLSYVLKHQEPETFDNFKANLLDMWALQSSSEQFKIFFQGLEDQTLAVLEDPDQINLVRHKVTESLSLISKYSKAEMENKYSVFLQGDAWTNNIMFKSDNDKVEESIMIDYQLSRNSSPVCDIMYMIFNCTDYESRKQHYNDWIDYYHSELEKCLSDFNLKANFVYPRDRLDADLKRYGKIMFGLSICLASMLIRKSDDAAKVMEAMKNEDLVTKAEELGVSNLDEETITLFKSRVTGLTNSFIEFGLL